MVESKNHYAYLGLIHLALPSVVCKIESCNKLTLEKQPQTESYLIFIACCCIIDELDELQSFICSGYLLML